MNPDDSENDQPGNAEIRSRARAVALRALGRREQSAKELQNKLTAQGFDDACVDSVVQNLKDIDLQSDQRYAEVLVRSRVSQGHGPRRIVAELATRGVGQSIIRELLAAVEDDWVEIAQRIYRKRFSAPPANSADRQKRYRFLSARGFDGEQIRAAMQEFDADDIE